MNLRPGQRADLGDGTSVRFDGARQFVNLQVSHDPAQMWVLVSAITMLAGLVVSLTVRRRRIWVRIYSPGPGEAVTVEMGGLARTDYAGWGPEFRSLRQRLLGDLRDGPHHPSTEEGVGYADR